MWMPHTTLVMQIDGMGVPKHLDLDDTEVIFYLTDFLFAQFAQPPQPCNISHLSAATMRRRDSAPYMGREIHQAGIAVDVLRIQSRSTSMYILWVYTLV